jgi:DNA replication protein DnaC
VFNRRNEILVNYGADPISADLKTVLRKLSRLLDTLPERLTLARQQKMPHQDFLLLVLTDEVTRRNDLAATLRAERAGLDPTAQLEHWDPTAKVAFDRALLNELATLRFLETHHHGAIVGPVGVGKTFLAHALGHTACRRGYSVLALRTDRMLKTLKHARLTQNHETELRKLLVIDLLLTISASTPWMPRRAATPTRSSSSATARAPWW